MKWDMSIGGALAFCFCGTMNVEGSIQLGCAELIAAIGSCDAALETSCDVGNPLNEGGFCRSLKDCKAAVASRDVLYLWPVLGALRCALAMSADGGRLSTSGDDLWLSCFGSWLFAVCTSQSFCHRLILSTESSGKLSQ